MRFRIEKMIKPFFVVLAVVVMSFCGCSLNSQTLTKKDLLEDLEYLNEAVSLGHPVILNAAWENKLEGFIHLTDKKFQDQLSALDYESTVRTALSKIGCSHTIIKASPLSSIYAAEIAEQPYLPIRLYANDSGLFLLEAQWDADQIEIEYPVTVLSINEKTADEIINALINYQPVDGYQRSLGFEIINRYASILVRRLFIGTSDFVIRYQDKKGLVAKANLKAVKEYSTAERQHFKAESTPLFSADNIDLYSFGSKSMCLNIKSMSYGKFQKTNAEIFRLVNDSRVAHLVIDLRGNGGGKTGSTFDFLSYILPDTLSQLDVKPKGNVSKYLNSKLKLFGVWMWAQITPHQKDGSGVTYETHRTHPKENLYRGNIYILTDGYTASSASTLASFLKHKANAICIGQETGGGETGCNANSFQKLVLPNSKIVINFPLFRFDYQLPIPDNHHGIIPDIPIEYTPSAYLANRDLEMEKVMAVIAQQ